MAFSFSEQILELSCPKKWLNQIDPIFLDEILMLEKIQILEDEELGRVDHFRLETDGLGSR
jgi:hypothetical protein